MSSDQPLAFIFSTKDPLFTSKTVVVSEKPNYISHSFVKAPIYDPTGKPIGYKVSDDYVQQVDANTYIVRLNNTYYFNNNGRDGSISWMYSFISTKPEIYYPVNVPVSSNITSTTGAYFNKKGTVLLFPLADGNRTVSIQFS